MTYYVDVDVVDIVDVDVVFVFSGMPPPYRVRSLLTVAITQEASSSILVWTQVAHWHPGALGRHHQKYPCVTPLGTHTWITFRTYGSHSTAFRGAS